MSDRDQTARTAMPPAIGRVGRDSQTPLFRLGLAAILIVAAALRFWSLGTSPGWFLDEGTYFDVARNLRDGKRQAGQIEVTFASPHMTAPPAWFLAEAAWMGVFGESMTAFRALVALCGIGCVALVAGIGRRLGGWKAGLWAAAFLAVAPRAVLYSRMAIPYMPTAALVLLWVWAMLLWERERKSAKRVTLLIIACLAAGLAPLTLYYGVVVIPAAVVWAGAAWIGRLRARRRGPAWPLLLPPLCAALALTAFLLYARWAWGQAFQADFRALRANMAPAPESLQIANWKTYLTGWGVFGGVWEWPRKPLALLGFLGLAFLRRGAGALAVGAAAFAFSHIVLRRLDAAIVYIDYPMMVAFPFLCLGLGMLAGRRIESWAQSKAADWGGWAGTLSSGIASGATWSRRVLAAAYALALAVYTLAWLSSGWTRPNPPTLSFGMIPSLAEAAGAVEWVNRHATSPTSSREQSAGLTPLVLASPNLWPLLDVPHGDINQLMAARGQGSGFYEYDCAREVTPALRAERIAAFVEDPITEHRRRPVVDNPENLADDSPWMILARAVDRFHQRWPSAFAAGRYVVRIPPHDAVEQDESRADGDD